MISAINQQRLEEARQLLLSQKFAEALSRYQKLSQLCPAVPNIWFEYGNAAARARKPELAERAWAKAVELAPRNSELITLIGHQYKDMRKSEKALALFAKAAAADEKSLNPRISRAVLLEQMHLLADSRAAVEQCLALDPRDDQARYFSAVLDRREKNNARAESRLLDLIASQPQHPYVRYACHYELAQLCDQTERFDEAMAQLLQAKQIVRGLTNTDLLLQSYDQGADNARKFTRSQPTTVLQSWSNSFPPSKRDSIPRLAFLGGHPRSGTTLLEQILGAHPQVAALDEPPAFIDVLEPAFLKTRDHSTARLNALRRLYLDALTQELGGSAGNKLLLDKNPSPTTRLPIWLRVFPELRVLIALRDPRDVVLSCFFQNIPLNAANVNFLSLERTAKHYCDLMDIWLTVKEWPGFAWLESRYEDMVQNPEAEGRRVTEFIGLEWDASQARFYEKNQHKQLYSPTYQDVTKPVYNRAVGRWHSYEKYLAPIQETLKPYCQKLGYD